MTKLPMRTPDGETRAGDTDPKHSVPEEAIRGAVLTSLGRPPGLYRVAVLPLWAGYYRVNVMTGPDHTSVLIPHSYFVKAGADGVVISATPPIVRQYP